MYEMCKKRMTHKSISDTVSAPFLAQKYSGFNGQNPGYRAGKRLCNTGIGETHVRVYITFIITTESASMKDITANKLLYSTKVKYECGVGVFMSKSQEDEDCMETVVR